MQLRGGPHAPAGQVEHRAWLACFRYIARYEGWPALYRGLSVAVIRAVPNTGIQFAIYEACKTVIASRELSQP